MSVLLGSLPNASSSTRRDMTKPPSAFHLSHGEYVAVCILLFYAISYILLLLWLHLHRTSQVRAEPNQDAPQLAPAVDEDFQRPAALPVQCGDPTNHVSAVQGAATALIPTRDTAYPENSILVGMIGGVQLDAGHAVGVGGHAVRVGGHAVGVGCNRRMRPGNDAAARNPSQVSVEGNNSTGIFLRLRPYHHTVTGNEVLPNPRPRKIRIRRPNPRPRRIRNRRLRPRRVRNRRFNLRPRRVIRNRRWNPLPPPPNNGPDPDSIRPFLWPYGD